MPRGAGVLFVEMRTVGQYNLTREQRFSYAHADVDFQLMRDQRWYYAENSNPTNTTLKPSDFKCRAAV